MLMPDFAFCHTVTIERWKGRNISKDEYAAPVTVKARVNLGAKKTWRQTGTAMQEVIASGKVYLPAGTAIAPNDKLVFGGVRYAVIAAQPRYWLDGSVNHVEAVIQ